MGGARVTTWCGSDCSDLLDLSDGFFLVNAMYEWR